MWRFWISNVHATSSYVAFPLISQCFLVWMLVLSIVHNRPAHRQCECFEIQSFTIETHENQLETHTMWRGEYFFEEIKTVYIRARKELLHIGLRNFWRGMSAWPAKPDTAWGTLHKSRTCSHNSLIRKNKSRTCGRQIPDFFGNPYHKKLFFDDRNGYLHHSLCIDWCRQPSIHYGKDGTTALQNPMLPNADSDRLYQ